MFSNIYKIWEMAVGLCQEVEGKMLSRTEGDSDDSLIAGNASAKHWCGSCHEPSAAGNWFPKRSLSEVQQRWQGVSQRQPRKTETRKSQTCSGRGCRTNQAHLANFKNDHSCIGEDMYPDGMVVLTAGEEDGTPFVMFFQDASEMEKC